MFSTTTMPLSTSIPKAKTRENKTITLNVMPKALKTMNDMNIESGMATPTNNALRRPRKKSKTPTTSNTPKMMEFCNSSTWVRVWSDWSFVMLTLRLEGR